MPPPLPTAVPCAPRVRVGFRFTVTPLSAGRPFRQGTVDRIVVATLVVPREKNGTYELAARREGMCKVPSLLRDVAGDVTPL